MKKFRAFWLEKSANNIDKEKQNAGSEQIKQNFSKAKGKTARQPSKVPRKKWVDFSGIKVLC